MNSVGSNPTPSTMLEETHYDLSNARRVAQLRQIFRRSECVHPLVDRIDFFTFDNCYIQYCRKCGSMLDLVGLDPRPERRSGETRQTRNA